MPSSKPRVLIIENSIHVTGALKSVTRTAYDLSGRYEFVFLIPKRSKGRSWIEAKQFNSVYELPMREISRSIKTLLVYFPVLLINTLRLKAIIEKEKIELIHVNDIYNLLPVTLRLLGNKSRYVCHIRFLPDRFPSWLFKFWLKLHLKFASKIIAVSESVRRQLPNHDKIVIIHNELPVEERYAHLLPKSPNEQKVFLYLSNFMNGKGQNFALEAFLKIHHQLPDWKLRFVGGDMGLKKNKDYREALKLRAQQSGLSDYLEWADFCEDVEHEYKNADIVLNFSESESFSITCLEALYFGRPLIVSDCGGPSEIVDHNLTGLLVENRNVEAMGHAMLTLAQDQVKRETLGRTARDVVRKKFSLENTSLKLQAVYADALNH